MAGTPCFALRPSLAGTGLERRTHFVDHKMITRRASVTTQNRPDVSRASFVHVVVPRTEQRCAEGEKRPHSVYLVRLLSHLGEYPTTDSWYELRYSRVAELHTHLRAEHPGLRLPWLPRARWLGSQHPAYVSAMREEIERYLRQLLTHWLRFYGGFDSFIMLLHAAHHGEPFPPPPDIPQNRRGSTSSGEPSFAPSTPASSRTTPHRSSRLRRSTRRRSSSASAGASTRSTRRTYSAPTAARPTSGGEKNDEPEARYGFVRAFQKPFKYLS